MAITYNLMRDEGPRTLSDNTKEYEIVYEAITTNSETPGEVVLGSGIGFLAGHPRDPLAFCTYVDPERHDEADDYFKLSFRFSTRVDLLAQGEPGQVSNPDPTQRGFRYRFLTRKLRQTITHDNLSRPIRNRANDLLDHEKEYPLLIIQVQKNIALSAFNANMLADFVGAVNSTTYLGFDPREVLLDDMTLEPKKEGGVAFWDTNAAIVVNKIRIDPLTGEERGGWITRKLNAGFNELKNGKHVPIILPGGQRPARPVLLDLFGLRLPAGVPGNPVNPIYLEFFTYDERDLNTLNLFS